MKNSAGQEGCYPPWPLAKVNNCKIEDLSWKKNRAHCLVPSRDFSMLWFDGYLSRFHLASDWLQNNKHSRHFLWCSQLYMYGKDFKVKEYQPC